MEELKTILLLVGGGSVAVLWGFSLAGMMHIGWSSFVAPAIELMAERKKH